MTDLARNGAKHAQEWLRTRRRLERMLRRGRLSGPQTLYSHELVVPMNSTYAPWHDDREFRAVYDDVLGSTLVDQYKCYELWEQVGQLTHVPGDILEVGVWRGGTGVLMARRVQQLGLDARVLCATPSRASPRPAATTRGTAAASTPTPRREIVKDWRPGRRRRGVLVGMFPDETGHRVADATLRLVHIDVDVYDSARDTLEWAWPRLSVGGVVIWDDYGSFQCEGVATLGRELFASDLEAGRLVHNINGHLLLFKLADAPLPQLATTT